MLYEVIYWDDRNDVEVMRVRVMASNMDEAEEEADRKSGGLGERYPISDIVQLTEEESEAEIKANLKKELEEFGIETYLREHLNNMTAQLVLSKFCSVTCDKLSEEDFAAMTKQVIDEVMEDY